ncbi:MAG: hypothetical protein HYX96_08550 [Chloroflexi bacterium]|nr:hypothetical protein [Chloroflexota bacterium]
MFYPVSTRREPAEAPVRALVCLTPAESKRLIARAVTALPEVKHALQHGTIYLARGITNAFVLEELTGEKVEPRSHYAAGVIFDGELAAVPAGVRMQPVILRQGKRLKIAPNEALADFTPADIVIKGANCIDPQGNAGVFVAGDRGGTVGEVEPILQSRGSHLIVAAGLEKLIPSVERASWVCGIYHFKYSTGVPAAVIPLPNARVVTEIQAFELLCGVCAVQVAAGGVAGSEGAVVLSLEGQAADIEKVMALVKSVKGEPPVARPAARTVPPAAQFDLDAMKQWYTFYPPAPPK